MCRSEQGLGFVEPEPTLNKKDIFGIFIYIWSHKFLISIIKQSNLNNKSIIIIIVSCDFCFVRIKT